MEEYRYLQELTERYPALKGLEEEIRAAFLVIKESFEAGGKLLVAGNGGSCADAEHIVGELMKSFVKPRPLPEALKEALIREEPGLGGALSEKLQGGLPAIALNSHPGLTSAFLNDVDGEMAYAQQVLGYGKKGRCVFGHYHLRKCEKYQVRRGDGKGDGPAGGRAHGARRRSACGAVRCGCDRAGKGDLPDSGAAPADLPRSVPDAGGNVLLTVWEVWYEAF